MSLLLPPEMPVDWPNRAMSRIVDSRPHRWHVQRAGARGPAVLLLHGAGASCHSWRDVLPALARHARVLAIDLPGQGFSRPGARNRFGLRPMAEDIAALLAGLDFAPDRRAGHSAGGALALQLALDLAAPTTRVVTFNAALEPFPGAAGTLYPLIARAMALNPLTAPMLARTATAGSVARLIQATGSRIDAAGLAQYRLLFRRTAHVEGTLAMMAQWDLAPLAARLPEVPGRVLLVTGGRDAAVPPASSDRAAARLARSERRDIPDVGHLLHEEASDAAIEALLPRDGIAVR